ncbi:MAG: hypothetical protein ACI9N1_002654 [Flavobacteriales bacterium]|jgi:hypothetical protein
MSKSPKHSEFKDQLGDLNLTPPASGWDGVVGAVANSVGEFSAIAEISSLPPAHIWPEIAAVLAPNRKRRIAYWWWSGAAAAVLIGVLFTFDFSSIHLEYSSQEGLEHPFSELDVDDDPVNKEALISEETLLPIKDSTSINNQKPLIAESQMNNQVDSNSSTNSVKELTTKYKGNNRSSSSSKDRIMANIKNTAVNVGTLDRFENWAIAFSPPKKAFIPYEVQKIYLINDFTYTPPPMPKVKPVSETILAANLGATSKSSNMNYGNLESFASSADASTQSGIVANSINSTYNVNADVIDYSQSLPVSFGLDVRKTFGASWFLSSGIIYSGTAGLLSYTVNSKEESLKVRDHYVGIPISIGVNFLDKRRFHLFSSISHLNEALLVRTEINSFPEINKSSSFLLSPQFGVGVNFGLLFKLKNNWGVSTAISAKSYYLAPDNSYWKSQRLWPALNISVVYNFTKKELFL